MTEEKTTKEEEFNQITDKIIEEIIEMKIETIITEVIDD
jgi:hypothetical protein